MWLSSGATVLRLPSFRRLSSATYPNDVCGPAHDQSRKAAKPPCRLGGMDTCRRGAPDVMRRSPATKTCGHQPIIGTRAMSDKAETAAIRLWRDRAHLREHERDDAQARAKIAEEKVAILTVENNQLADEIARLRALLNPDAAQARAETEQQMQVLKTALLALLDQSQPAHSRSATSAWLACAVNPCAPP